MKKFNWINVDVSADSPSIWNRKPSKEAMGGTPGVEPSAPEPLKFDYTELEQLFGMRKAPQTPKGLRRAGSAANSPAISSPQTPRASALSRTLLDSNQTMQVGFVLKQFGKATVDDIIGAVKRLDAKYFGVEQLEGLSRVMADAKLKHVADRCKKQFPDGEGMPENDAFVTALSMSKNTKERVDLLLLYKEFSAIRDDLAQKVSVLDSLADAVISNEALVSVFDIVLHLGNFLNSSSRGGPAAGFATKSLLRLEDTRANVGGSTLLDTVVKYAVDMVPDVTTGLRSIETATESAKNIDISGLHVTVERTLF